MVQPWYRDVRFGLVLLSLLALAVLDVLLPDVGFRTFLIVPVVASIALGRWAWTVAFGVAAMILYAIVSLQDPGDPVLYWRRVLVLVATIVVSVLLAAWVGRGRRRLARESERLTLLLENGTDVVFQGTNEGVLSWISPQCARHVGWTAEQMIGHPFVEFVHPDDMVNVRAAQADVLAGRPASFTARLRTEAGDWRWMSIRVNPVRDARGTVVGRVGGWTDVHDVVVAQHSADARRDQIRAMLDALLDPFIYFEPVRDDAGHAVDLRFVEANDAAFAYNLSTPEAMLGHTFMEFFPGLMEHGPMAQYLRCMETGEPVILDDYAYPNEILHGDRRYDIRAMNAGEGMVLTWRDVTDRHQAVEDLAASERRYRLLAENATDVIWEVSPENSIMWASDSSARVLGWQAEDLVGCSSIDFIHPDDQAMALSARRRILEGSQIRENYRVRRPDGTYLWMAFAAQGVEGPEGVTRIVTLRDVDAEVTAREELAQIVGRDPLTGLLTREALQERLRARATGRRATPVAVLCVGVDSLSIVNEAYTHSAGDVVLAAIAKRIVQETSAPDLVARGAGVDFLAAIWDDAESGASSDLAERIRRAAREEILVGPHRIRATVSIGVASGESIDDPEQLIRAATTATRTAKDAGRDRIAYATQAQAQEAERRLALASAVSTALQLGEITAWFQPIAHLADGTLAGYEALARWHRADGTVVEPPGFLSVLERSPQIRDVDLTALRCALRVLRQDPHGPFVSVNVSALSLASAEYLDVLMSEVTDDQIDPTRLHLEVTETTLLDVSAAVVARMQRAADAGLRWYVDDFGTGYSSISHLRDLPIHGLKLDLSFTAGVGRGDQRSIRLSQALAGMAHGLGLDTVAEGVETNEQVSILMAQGWRYGQGWYFGRAVDASTLLVGSRG